MTAKLWVGLACNDDYGQDTGYVRAIDFGDFLQLEGNYLTDYDPNPRWTLLDKTRMRFSRRVFAVHGHCTWWGNMAWDAVLMDIDEAQRLAEYARDLDKFSPQQGYASVWDAWKVGEPIVFEEDER